MYKLLLSTLICISLIACAGMEMKKYNGEKKKTYIETITLNKSDAYEKSMVWLAKNLGDSNQAIKVKDKELGRIVARVSYACVGFKRPDLAFGIPDSTDINFNVDVAIKDKKIKYELEILGFNKQVPRVGNLDMDISDAEGQKEAIESCFISLKKDLYKSLETTSNSNW
jgi:hypothetical protein